MSNTFFADISAIGKIRVSGLDAPKFIHIMTTVEANAVSDLGQVAPALLLTAQAEIIDIVMIARSGPQEFMLTTDPNTVQEVFEWLLAHSQIADDQGLIFADLDISNQTDKIATLALYGDDVELILGEITNTVVTDSLSDVNLGIMEIGQLPVMILKWPFLNEDVHEIHLPAAAVQDLQNLLLSFAEIDPESFAEYQMRRKAAHTWFIAAGQESYIKPVGSGFSGLIRRTLDFVGSQAFQALQGK